MAANFFTIGHSNRTFQEFTELLQASEVELLVDVRKLPGSNRYPQFNADALVDSLQPGGIELRRIAALTGRRPVSKDVPFEVNGWWQNRSFHNYADHALSQEFAGGLTELRTWGRSSRVAIMCSEAVWWRCHRRIIADHLLANGEGVHHILGAHNIDEAQLSAGAQISDSGVVTYPVTES